MSLYVDGNAARKIEPELPEIELTEEEQKRRRRRKALAQAKAQQRARAQAALIRTAVILAVSAVVMFLLITALNGTVKTNELTTEIKSLESDYEKLLNQNDSKEYDIDRSVDLNMIIKTATEEYGMVRGSVDQIITYQPDDTEYIQQMAELPD